MNEAKIKMVIESIDHCLQLAPDGHDTVAMTMRTAKDIKESLEDFIALKAHEEKAHLFCKNVCEPQYKAEVKRLRQNSAGLRPCYVRGKKALFHKWVQRRELISSSIARGGHNGGEVELTLAIVEFENGQASEAHPRDIRFADSAGLFKQFAFDEEREAKT